METDDFGGELRSCDVRRVSEIYLALAKHQRQEDWDLQPQAASLLSWTKRFNREFKLQINEIALRFEHLPTHIYSHFRSGYNGFGLRGEITFNTRHFGGRRLGLILCDLLHELVHAWQHEYGRPADRGRHNRQYRAKAAEVGLVVTETGATSLAADSAFAHILGECGISVPDVEAMALPSSIRQRVAGDSKLKKWTCSCPRPVSVRVAVSDFQAMCLKCNCLFRRVSGMQAQDGADSS